MSEYKCYECEVGLDKHDYCEDWFGYTMDTGYICPSCGTQYEKKEYSELKRRDKKEVCLVGSQRLRLKHLDSFEIKVPWNTSDKIEFEGEVFKKSSEKTKDGHFKYKLVDSIYETQISIKNLESRYIRKNVNQNTPPNFLDWEAPHSDVRIENDSIWSFLGSVSLNDLNELNYLHRYDR